VDRTWTEILIDWFPMLLLIGVWVFAMYRSRNLYVGKSGKTHGEMLEEHVGEMKRQNDLLERIMKDQESRLQRLEAARPSH
jgi:ATP-dependent Zn protease